MESALKNEDPLNKESNKVIKYEYSNKTDEEINKCIDEGEVVYTKDDYKGCGKYGSESSIINLDESCLKCCNYNYYENNDLDSCSIPKALLCMGIKDLNSWKTNFDDAKDWYTKNKILQVICKSHYDKYKSENRVLIHCSMGVSRSPTIAIMYIMKKFSLTFDEVYKNILIFLRLSNLLNFREKNRTLYHLSNMN